MVVVVAVAVMSMIVMRRRGMGIVPMATTITRSSPPRQDRALPN